jgi:hypothetical protein
LGEASGSALASRSIRASDPPWAALTTRPTGSGPFSPGLASCSGQPRHGDLGQQVALQRPAVIGPGVGAPATSRLRRRVCRTRSRARSLLHLLLGLQPVRSRQSGNAPDAGVRRLRAPLPRLRPLRQSRSRSTTSTATRWTTGWRTRSRSAAIATTRRRFPASEGIRRNIAYSDRPAASRAGRAQQGYC